MLVFLKARSASHSHVSNPVFENVAKLGAYRILLLFVKDAEPFQLAIDLNFPYRGVRAVVNVFLDPQPVGQNSCTERLVRKELHVFVSR